MSKIQHLALLSLLAVLLCQAGLVEAICGHCYGSHACIDENTAQLCFDGVPNANYTIPCPADTPICTQYGDMCMANLTGVVKPACGDTSLCSQCTGTFACTSRTSFAYCSNGAVEGSARITCPNNTFCSVSGAADGTPCVVACEPDPSDTCDRENDDSDDTTTTTETPSNGTTTTTETPSNGTTTTPSTNSTTTTPATPTDANSFCQLQQTTGRYAIPNDTVCTSFIHCSYKGAWLGSVVNCTTTKPYFLATNSVCGTVQPTRAGCLA